MIEKIVIDIDGTLWNLIRCITDLYNDDFQYYSKFQSIDWQDVKTWDFQELELATPEYINIYFNQPRFFKTVQLMPYAQEVIDRLSERYEIIFCSLCYSPNGRGKEAYIKKYFPYAKFINVSMKEYKDKSHIDMHRAVFLDDDVKNLNTCNADIKICYGDIYPWNEEWDGDRCYNWLDFEQLIIDLEHLEDKENEEHADED